MFKTRQLLIAITFILGVSVGYATGSFRGGDREGVPLAPQVAPEVAEQALPAPSIAIHVVGMPSFRVVSCLTDEWADMISNLEQGASGVYCWEFNTYGDTSPLVLIPAGMLPGARAALEPESGGAFVRRLAKLIGHLDYGAFDDSGIGMAAMDGTVIRILLVDAVGGAMHLAEDSEPLIGAVLMGMSHSRLAE